MNIEIIGVDVSKDNLAVCGPNGKPYTVTNNKQGIKGLLRRLSPGAVVAMEATGKYHRLLANSAYEKGFTVYVFNPKDVLHYGKSVSPRAKTDKVDAGVIALFAQAKEHRPYQPVEEFVDRLKSLGRTRASLVRQRVAQKAQMKEHPEIAGELKKSVASLGKAIKSLEKQMIELAGRIPEYRLLLKVKGLGAISAAYLGAILASGTFKSSDAFVAYLGLDLRVRESGMKRGRRGLSKRGDPEARRLLYLGALAACRSDGPLRELRLRYLARGYSKTEAIVFAARKLARIAWAIYTKKEIYRPERVLSQSGTQIKADPEAAVDVADKRLSATSTARAPETGARVTQEQKRNGRKKAA